ncbi:MAG: hypothetical protein QOG64_843 [Acidimicrobiaceae bacterium]|nr:hypothetical protein [Acidimicrobiaceae bacterium]
MRDTGGVLTFLADLAVGPRETVRFIGGAVAYLGVLVLVASVIASITVLAIAAAS